MADKRKNCGTNHHFREHGIGAGLTRRICTGCGLLGIGQGRRPVLVEDLATSTNASVLVKAG